MLGVLIVGGGEGATTTDGEIPRRMEPDRVLLFNFGLATITGLLVIVAAAVALRKTLEPRGRRLAVVDAFEVAPAGDGARTLLIFVFGVGNRAVTADEVFR